MGRAVVAALYREFRPLGQGLPQERRSVASTLPRGLESAQFLDSCEVGSHNGRRAEPLKLCALLMTGDARRKPKIDCKKPVRNCPSIGTEHEGRTMFAVIR